MTEKKVDESWKEQVKKDRGAAPSAAKEPSPAKTEPEPEPADRAGHDHDHDHDSGQMPPADFGVFISSLGLQAMMALGDIENPLTGKKDIDRVQAKYLIDTIGMLQEKTKGNLTPEENSMIDQMLYELRMKYVAGNK